eukprot:295242-Chlamydomonas_euryale.AAC.12
MQFRRSVWPFCGPTHHASRTRAKTRHLVSTTQTQAPKRRSSQACEVRRRLLVACCWACCGWLHSACCAPCRGKVASSLHGGSMLRAMQRQGSQQPAWWLRAMRHAVAGHPAACMVAACGAPCGGRAPSSLHGGCVRCAMQWQGSQQPAWRLHGTGRVAA